MPQFSYNPQGQLQFYGKSLPAVLKTKARQAVREHCPVYLYHTLPLKQACQNLQTALRSCLQQDFAIHYAMKANSNPQILRLLRRQGLNVDLVSGGELQLALEAGFSGPQILFSGVGKTEPEISQAIAHKIFQLNVESLPELERVGQIAGRLRTPVNIGLRLNPGVNPKTHPYITTGFRENKFGLDPAHLTAAIQLFTKYNYLKFQGLGMHIGSQIFDFSALAEAIVKTRELLVLTQDQGFSAKVFDVGGGMGVDYSQNSEASDPKVLQKYLRVLQKNLRGCEQKICLEPGRSIVARSGVLLTQVQYVKQTPYKCFVIVNTGMNHLLRPALYQAEHRIFPLRRRAARGRQGLVDVVGPVCESSDVLAKNCRLPGVQAGDWLAIADVGAYGFSMASHYNSFALPEEILL